MTPALWAVVDAVLVERSEERWRELALLARMGTMSAAHLSKARRADAKLGWWRSCWPVGGGK